MRSHLEQVQVDGVFIEHSPFRADRTSAASCAGNAELTTFEIRDIGSPYLVAGVRHNLGAAGFLDESYTVGGDVSPIRIPDDPGYRVSFWYTGPSGESTELAPCDAVNGFGDAPYDALEVLVGEGPDGEQRVVARSFRTRDTFAGSYSVRFNAAAIADPSGAYPTWTVADGFFAHVYVAQHHNWEDESVLYFDRDPVNYHLHFRDGAPPFGTAVRRVELLGIDAFNTGAGFDVVTADLEAGADSTVHFTLQGPAMRLDSTSLLRSISGAGPRCAGDALPTVLGLGPLGAAPAVLQLLTCARAEAPGFAVVGVLPVLVAQTQAIGTLVTDVSESSPQGQATFSFSLDAVPYTLTFPFELTGVLNDGTNELYLAMGQVDTLVRDRYASSDSSEHFESADGRVQFDLALRWAQQGAGSSAIYAPLSAVLRIDEDRYVAGALDALLYENTHHNWYDALTAFSGDVTFNWRVSTELAGCADAFLCYFVSATRGAEELLPETSVRLISQ